jgi:cytochrome c oxidase subunit 3
VIVGIFLFIGSEIMLFGSFFTVYFFDRVVNNAHPWPPIDPATGLQYHRPWFVALVNTFILVTSSFTMHWATVSTKRGYRTGMQAGLVLTILLGLTFLLTQVIEYHRLGFNTSDGAFASTFFGLTGLHGCHDFVGLVLLTVMAVRAFRGHFSPEHHHGIEIGGIYWHFVDVMWIVVYVTVYLL